MCILGGWVSGWCWWFVGRLHCPMLMMSLCERRGWGLKTLPVVRERAAEGLSVTGSWNNPPFVPSEGLYECAPSLQTSQMESQRASDRKYSKPHKSLQARPRLAYLRFGFRVAWRGAVFGRVRLWCSQCGRPEACQRALWSERVSLWTQLLSKPAVTQTHPTHFIYLRFRPQNDIQVCFTRVI